MSEQMNMDVVQQVYTAFGRGDISTVLSLITEDVQWSLPGPSLVPFAGTRQGQEGVAEFFSLLGEALEFEQFEPQEFVVQGDTVVVLGYERYLVNLTGDRVEQEWAHVYTLRDGKIARGRFFEDTAAQVVGFSALRKPATLRPL